jgi:nitrite reductase/ring-hydroxylating ferredoxin subunit
VFAIDALCSHMGVPLEQGSIDGEEIVCPWHSARFCMKTGVKTAGRPNWQAIKSYPARIVEGVIEIGIETGLAAERVATQACAGPPSRAIA